MKRYNRFMEIFWLVLAIVMLVVVCYFIITDGFMQSFQLLVFPALSAMMYAFRRGFRRRLEKYENGNK